MGKDNGYVPLVCYTEYSISKSIIRCNKLTERLKEIGVTSCAITDYNSVSGAIDFHTNMKKNGIKPILGCCFDIYEDASVKNSSRIGSLIVLAKNESGWKHLLKLVSLSNSPNRYFNKPQLNITDIKEVNTDQSLICITGMHDSYLANQLSEITPDDRMIEGCKMCVSLQDIFGKENFFLSGMKFVSHMSALSGLIEEISEYCDIKTVATPAPHYYREEDAEDHHVLLSALHNQTVDKIKREKPEYSKFFSSSNYHILSNEYAKEIFDEEEIELSRVISDMCEEYDITHPPDPPEFECPDGMTDIAYLRKLCIDGWNKKIVPLIKEDPTLKEAYGERVKYELNVFEEYNLASYFLIVRDILEYCRGKKMLLGVGRGSACGCLVSYLVDITQLDPIKYHLLFERFLNPGRLSKDHISLPDIDIDVPQMVRQDVIDYLREKYGKDNVAQIMTYTTMKGKKALKQVMTADGGYNFAMQNSMTENLLDEAMISEELQEMKDSRGFKSGILWALEHRPEKFKEWVQVDEEGNLTGEYAHVFEQAMRLEYTKIIQSRHAAGVIVSTKPISDSCPMIRLKSSPELIAGFEGESCEAAGLLKLDTLGIVMLDKVMGVAELGVRECT